MPALRAPGRDHCPVLDVDSKAFLPFICLISHNFLAVTIAFADDGLVTLNVHNPGKDPSLLVVDREARGLENARALSG